MIGDASRDAFEERLRSLLVQYVSQQIPAANNDVTQPPGGADLAYLLSVASRLALSKTADDRRAAYDAATLALELVPDIPEPARVAVEAILSRLGNFPARGLAERRNKQGRGNGERRPIQLALEALAREADNTVAVRDRDVLLTDFQRRLFEALDRHNSVSISAPTSAGKSFLLSLDVVRQQSRQSKGAIVFVVPTRALIRQVMRDVLEQLRSFGMPDVSVMCVPEALPDGATQDGVVYVLTQERLTTLLATHGGSVPISLLIVDEAQELGDGGRGIVLQSAVESTLRLHPDVRVLFACPLRSNPGFVLQVFSRHEQGEFFVERLAPVSQNVILIEPVKQKPQLAQMRLWRRGELVPVAVIDLPFSLRQSPRPLLAAFSVFVTKPGDTTIVYVNGPRDAEVVASEIAAQIDPVEGSDSRIDDLIQFLRDNLHPSYPLIEVLRRRVAFHYGYMPEIVRVAVEDLLRAGVIRFVCCTSTLLQGVNLPAKNVVILRPTRGRGRPLDKGGFWNLAGRAGRLTREFRGNVWCVRPGEWDEDPFDGDQLVEITAAFREELVHNGNAVAEAAADEDRPAEQESTREADQVFAKVFADFALESRALADSDLCGDKNRESCERIDAACADLAGKITVPPQLFGQHYAASPYRIEELAGYFRRVDTPDDFLPQHPLQPRGLQRVQHIFGILEETFFKTGNRSYVYHGALAWWWMTGTPLRALISSHLQHNNVPDEPRRVSAAIRELLEDVENVLRYRYVKYLRLYQDVLLVYYAEVGRDDLAGRVSPLHLFIEYGACDEALIHLIGLGMSRSAAIAFADAVRLSRSATWLECRQIVEAANLDALGLPVLVVREIEAIRRR